MKGILKFFCVFLALLSSIFCFSCATPFSSYDLFYFNTQIHIQVDGALSANTLSKTRDLFTTLEQTLSASNPNSIISKYNDGQVGQSFELNDDAISLLQLSKKCYSLSDGKFNPSVLPLVKLWDFFPNYPVLNFTPPTQEKIDSAKQLVMDFSTLNIDQTQKTLRKTNDGGIDLGGILKGYALDKVAKILKDAGHQKGYISIGSSSLYLLQADSLGVKHPRATSDTPLILSVNTKSHNNLSVATSGDYEKTYSFGGQTYSHIINPKTGYPTDTGVQSATIIGGDGGVIDALSTALCLCEYDQTEGCELLSMIDKILLEFPTAKIFVTFDKDGVKEIITNQTIDKDFTLLDFSYQVKKV